MPIKLGLMVLALQFSAASALSLNREPQSFRDFLRDAIATRKKSAQVLKSSQNPQQIRKKIAKSDADESQEIMDTFGDSKGNDRNLKGCAKIKDAEKRSECGCAQFQEAAANFCMLTWSQFVFQTGVSNPHREMNCDNFHRCTKTALFSMGFGETNVGCALGMVQPSVAKGSDANCWSKEEQEKHNRKKEKKHADTHEKTPGNQAKTIINKTNKIIENETEIIKADNNEIYKIINKDNKIINKIYEHPNSSSGNKINNIIKKDNIIINKILKNENDKIIADIETLQESF